MPSLTINDIAVAVIAGLSVGVVYALFAVGFNLVFGVMRALNLSHAGVFAWAAIVGVWVASILPSYRAPVALVAGLVVGAALSYGVDLVALRPLRRRRASVAEIEMSTFISTLALFFILENTALLATDAQVLRYPSGTFELGITSILGLDVQLKHILVAAISVLVMFALQVLLRTKLGKAIRSVAANTELARYIGINTNRVYAWCVVISGALAGIAGVLIGMSFNLVSFGMGQTFLLKAILITIIAGLGSIGGAVVASLLLGLSESVTVFVFGSNWRDVVSFILLLTILLIRPVGLFGEEERLGT